jgi:large subunit ribosomal protein L10
MSKHVKEMIMRDYKDRLGATSDAMVISLRGVKGTAATTIRNDLAKKQIKITVVRNSLAKKSFEGTPLATLNEFLTGSSALAYGGQSVVEVAREIVKLIEKNPLIELRGAVLDGMIFKGKAGVTELSKFPTKDEAIVDIVTLVVSPARKLMGQLKGPGATVGGLIKAVETKLEKGEAIAKAG